MTPAEKQARLAVDKARIWAMENVPFYGALAGNLSDEYGQVPTACTDGRKIIWSADFLATLKPEEVRAVLLHETLHCVHGHMWRFPVKSPEVQTATDAVINRTLETIPGISLPDGAVLRPQFNGLSEEEIVQALRKPKPEQPPQPEPDTPTPAGQPADDGNAPGQPGPGEPTPDPCGDWEPAGSDEPDPTAQAEARAEMQEMWEGATERAALASGQLAGTLPGDMQRILTARRTAQPDWKAETADFLRSSIATRTDYTRSARRFATAPVIYPRRKPDSTGLVVVVRDTSGSIDAGILSAFNDLIGSALDETGAECLLIDCDARIHAEYRLAPGEPPPATAKGGGGTDLRPPFERAIELAAQGESVAGLIYLTDLEGPTPTADQVHDLPHLWVCTTHQVATTGRTVRVTS